MKKAISLIASLSLLTTPLVGSFAISCSRIPCERIELFCSATGIKPGEKQQIRAIIYPTGQRYNNLNWKLVKPINGVYISNEGLLSVDDNVTVTEIQTILIEGHWKNKYEIFGQIKISLLPASTYDFQGFVNNELQFINRAREVESIPIIQTSEFEYELERPVDLFVFDSVIKPEGFTSFINFTPIAGGQTVNYMSFCLENGMYQPHAIVWEPEYSDGNWIDRIPDFDTVTPALLYDSINVHFSCDPRVNFHIDFKTWMNPYMFLSAGIMALMPLVEDDPHEMHFEGVDGVYTSQLFCPSYLTTGVYHDTIASIYCFRPKYEYTEYEFEITMDSKIDPEIKDMLEFSLSEPVIEERPFDHLIYYKVNLSYSFDLSKRKHTADYWHFQDIPLFTLLVKDPVFYTPESPTYASYCRFYLNWI